MNESGFDAHRRAFLGLIAGATISPWVYLPRSLAESSGRILKRIPSTGEQLPVVGVGTSRTFDVSEDAETMERLAQVLRIFFDQGGTLIDSSPMYGEAEVVIGRLLAAIDPPDALFTATKVWTTGTRRGVEQMENSRRLWRIPHFDLIQIHNLVDWRTHLETLQEWKTQGRVRYIGITTSHGRSHRELEQILSTQPFDFVQLSYSIGEREVEQRLLPLAAERGIAVIANRPFQRGALFRKVKGRTLPSWAQDIDCRSWSQFFLKFVISHPAVTCTIPATSKPHHMIDNMGAMTGRLPDMEMRRRMIDLLTG